MDQAVPVGPRMSMWMHLLMCPDCLRFTRQLKLLRLAVRRFGRELEVNGVSGPMPPEVRERLERCLPKDP
jgi:hypothetical protein